MNVYHSIDLTIYCFIFRILKTLGKTCFDNDDDDTLIEKLEEVVEIHQTIINDVKNSNEINTNQANETIEIIKVVPFEFQDLNEQDVQDAFDQNKINSDNNSKSSEKQQTNQNEHIFNKKSSNKELLQPKLSVKQINVNQFGQEINSEDSSVNNSTVNTESNQSMKRIFSRLSMKSFANELTDEIFNGANANTKSWLLETDVSVNSKNSKNENNSIKPFDNNETIINDANSLSNNSNTNISKASSKPQLQLITNQNLPISNVASPLMSSPASPTHLIHSKKLVGRDNLSERLNLPSGTLAKLNPDSEAINEYQVSLSVESIVLLCCLCYVNV